MSTNLSFESRLDLTALTEALQSVRVEMRKIIVGQEELIDLLITAVLANGHVLIEGVPGVAKTLSAKLMARSLSAEFSRIQFTPDLMPSDVLGTSIFNPKTTDFEFKRGPIFSNIILIDEINRAPAKTQSALFEVMEERQVSADGVTYVLHNPFLIFATQNPLEHEGTYRLPEAQLDRFLFKIEVGYPSLEEEVQILSGLAQEDASVQLETIQAILSAEDVGGFQALVRHVHIEDPLVRYIAQLIQQTRSHAALDLGASPRASLALLQAAKAKATMDGRDFVKPEDIQTLAYPVLRHRIMLTAEQEMEGKQPDDVIRRIIEQIEVPR